MIGRISGTLVERGLDGACIVDVQGVGYEVTVALGTLGRMPSNGEGIVLFVHTHVREDALTLYGFSSIDDRAAFRALLSVSSVGPKVALAILGVLDASSLSRAVAVQDRTAFKGISGVGKKIIERILLDLKDKLPTALATSHPHPNPRKPSVEAADDPLGFVANALVSMGYKPNEADRAIATLSVNAAGKPIETLLREALQALT